MGARRAKDGHCRVNMGQGVEALDKFAHDPKNAPGVRVGKIKGKRFLQARGSLKQLLVRGGLPHAGASVQACVRHWRHGMMRGRRCRLALLVDGQILIGWWLCWFLLAHNCAWLLDDEIVMVRL